MLVSSLRRPRALKVIAAIAGIAASLAAVMSLAANASCVLADPPPDLPAPAKHHPIIVKSSVSPPYTQVLPALPSRFVVPVELIDPNTPSFLYEVFLDYDGSDPGQRPYYVPTQPVQPSPATVDGGITNIEFEIATAPPDPSSCHRLELLVAFSFDLAAPHTPDAYGADSVVWFYNPSGDPGSCPLFDAGGADGAAPDQQSDVIFMPPPPDGGE
jgi:hypothetical protein